MGSNIGDYVESLFDGVVHIHEILLPALFLWGFLHQEVLKFEFLGNEVTPVSFRAVVGYPYYY